MAKVLNATMQNVGVLAKAAEDNVAPRHVADRIVATSTHARDEDRRMIASAAEKMDRATAALHGYVVSARRGDEQNRWLAWTAIGAVAFGMFLWAAFAGAVARAVPESWLWPERMAARTLRLDPWDASRRLAGVSRPETWNTMVRGAIMMQDNEAAIERCRRIAAKAREAVSCTVRIGPGERRRER